MTESSCEGLLRSLGGFGAFLDAAGFWSIEGGTERLPHAIPGEPEAALRPTTPVGAVEDDGSGVRALADGPS
ncbi:hypothetical protein ACIPPM_06175 [Streptomyces sp. NPDC090119]|uniref:hypothetical protein n=1 Tax=Streptomyces sp. NPDC090119 TaxID=3365951 RepID=UPI0037F83E2C